MGRAVTEALGVMENVSQSPTDPLYFCSIYRIEATNFRMSAEILARSFETPSDKPPATALAIPFCFLISHAAELLLKSALLKRGLGTADLKTKRLRHSLLELMRELQSKNVVVSPQTIQILEVLHPQHESHALRYTALVDDGKPTIIPAPTAIFCALDELLLLTRKSTQGL